MEPKIFLSHSKKDKPFIKKLAKDLEVARLKVWYDDLEIALNESLKEKIFDEGIPESVLFFVYYTKHSIDSDWVRQEVEAALKTEKGLGYNFVVPCAESSEIVESLPGNLKERRVLILNEEIYFEPVLELTGFAWEAVAKRREIEARSGLIRGFKDRYDLQENTNFAESIRGAQSFDMISLSANVLKSFEDQFREILKQGAKIRLVLYDTGEKTEVFYDSLSLQLNEITSTRNLKRQETESMLATVEVFEELIKSQKFKGSIELKWLSGKPLYYNLWIKDRGETTTEANLSVYFYRDRYATPVFRANHDSKGLIDALGVEFDHVWEKADDAPSEL